MATRRQKYGNPALIASGAMSNPELMKTGRIILYFAIGLLVIVVAYLLIKRNLDSAKLNKNYAESTVPGNDAYYARQIYNAGAGSWWDVTKWGDDNKLLQLACELGKAKNYTTVSVKFREMFDEQLTEYVSRSLNNDEMIEFDNRATGQTNC